MQSGAAIWKRLEEKFTEISPDSILAADVEALRGCGLSRPKVRYAHCLAEAIAGGGLALDELRVLSDEAAICALTSVVGVGRWTAEVYLMFALARPDVWPAGDIALAASAQRLLELEQRPDQARLREIAERWRPWRTTAALVLWRFYKRVPLG